MLAVCFRGIGILQRNCLNREMFNNKLRSENWIASKSIDSFVQFNLWVLLRFVFILMHSQTDSVWVSVACGNGHWRTSKQIQNIQCRLRVLHCTSTTNTFACTLTIDTIDFVDDWPHSVNFISRAESSSWMLSSLFSLFVQFCNRYTLKKWIYSIEKFPGIPCMTTNRKRPFHHSIVHIPRYCLSVVHTNAVSQKSRKRREEQKLNETRRRRRNKKNQSIWKIMLFIYFKCQQRLHDLFCVLFRSNLVKCTSNRQYGPSASAHVCVCVCLMFSSEPRYWLFVNKHKWSEREYWRRSSAKSAI